MSTRRPLLSALAALSLGAAPALAVETPAEAQPQDALASYDLTGQLTGQIARVAALIGTLDEEMARRLDRCLEDLRPQTAEVESVEDLVWRSVRDLDCRVTLQAATAQLAQAEIY